MQSGIEIRAGIKVCQANSVNKCPKYEVHQQRARDRISSVKKGFFQLHAIGLCIL